jgi:hypothetical protein
MSLAKELMRCWVLLGSLIPDATLTGRVNALQGVEVVALTGLAALLKDLQAPLVEAAAFC